MNTSTLNRFMLLAGMCLIATALALFLLPSAVHAQEDQPSTDPQPGDEVYCVVCHVESSQSFTLEDGSVHLVNVDLNELAASVHGEGNPEGALTCTDCHEGVVFPHEETLPATDRLFTISRSLNCTNCHEEQTRNLADGVHYTALVEGNLRAASCVDCHGGHDVSSPHAEVWTTSEMCGDCHVTTFNEYEDSVHGEALFSGDENVPACIDCHGVHGINHPTTALFRNRSPELCATCHGDKQLMEEYDISTNIFNSYLTDFHGETVTLFSQTASNVPANKAVCYDCHGVHNITPADDEKSQVVRENLVTTCQKCHPDATSDFPDSWVGHFPPTVDSHPLLFGVDWFYKILIPMTLGGFILLVGTDVFRLIRQWLGFGKHREEE